MTLKLARRIARNIADIGWTSRIEFAMHGEPTMNPELAEIINVFWTYLPPENQLMVTSNGAGLAGSPVKSVNALFHAGLNILALDDYKNQKFFEVPA